ncbi:AAA family ATPase [Ruegeria sp. HKCCD5849]|uniref:AAA family ATPase n=1 Tax=unclassified Ruegeria TaxID=2625375 RepID=UPI0014916527|nr:MULTISPECIES: AAA family ATPase [unclassified Ruegeria]NOD46390.1 AAA family ATPase [Ruegeria sp. HKCCD5849]NOD50310.1 AAA family ATPase [Ruegeria sp. HKCCD5851]
MKDTPEAVTGATFGAWDRATAERNWLVFAVTPPDPQTGKTGKFPTDRVGSEFVHEKINFDRAVGADQAAHYTYTQAHQLVEGLKPFGTITHYAVGYLPRPGSALVVGDLDNCRNPANGDVADWAAAILSAGFTYAEVSTSGTGIRLLMERMEGDDQHTSGERNGAGFFANGKRAAVLTGIPLDWYRHPPQRAPAVRDAILARWGHTALANERHTASVTDPVDYQTVRELLMALPNPDYDYDTWRDVGYSIKHALGDDGWPLFEWWSAQAPKNQPKTTAKIWKGLNPDGSITFGKLVHMVKAAHGGALPAHIQAVMDQRRAKRHMAHMPAAVPPDLAAHMAVMPAVAPQPPVTMATFKAHELAMTPIPPREWLVKDWIPLKTVTMLGGDGGVGKSLLALQLAVSTSLGRPWMGMDAGSGPVLYLSAEDDTDELHRRLSDISGGYQVPLNLMRDLTIVPMAGKDAIIAAPELNGVLKPTPVMQQLRNHIDRIGPRLIVLDTLADLNGGNENDRAQARQFIGMLRGIAIDYGCAVVLLAHPSKTGMATGDGTSGSTGWNNSVRSRIYLDRVQQDGEELDSDLRVMKRMKANYAAANDDVNLRWSAGCFDALPKTAENVDAAMLQIWQSKFMDLLRRHVEKGRNVSPNRSNSFAPKVFAEHPDADGVTKVQFNKSMESLLDMNVIGVEDIGPKSKRSQIIVIL